MLVLARLARNWWTLVLRGLIAIIFGILALVQPGMTLGVLVLLIGLWALFDGILALISSIGAAQSGEPWWPLVLAGLLSVAVGLLVLRWPGITALVLLFIIAYWAILTGILQIAAAIRLRHEVQGDFWFLLGGIASVVFGILVIGNPGSGALAIIWLIGLYALILGIALMLAGFRLKGVAANLPAVQ